MRLLLSLLVVALFACNGGRPQTSPSSTTTTAPPSSTTTITTPSTTTAPAPPETSPLAARTSELQSAIFEADASVEAAPTPVWIGIDSIDVDRAQITPVGVLDTGEMEIPTGQEVGWYRFGPRPGEDGSAVLAAHISFDGRDGVFRHLARVDPGDLIEIGFDDGSRAIYEVVETAQYPKDGLPFERVFSRDGTPVITLITCGGDFNRSIRSYSDNVVAYAVPAGR